MIRRSTWIVLVIFVALVGFTWYWQKYQGKSKVESTPTPGLGSLSIIENAKLASLKVTDSQGKSTWLERDPAGNWVLKEPSTEAVDEVAVQSMLSELEAVNILNKLDTAPDPSATGLDHPAFTITLSSFDGKQQVIDVGKVTPTESGYYVSSEGSVLVVNRYSLQGVLDIINKPPIAPTVTPTKSTISTPESTPVPSVTPESG